MKAADARLTEGEALVDGGYPDAGIYLLGYAAEMVLKTAYCRVDPAVNISKDLIADRFGSAATQWKSLFPGQPLPKQRGHDLLFWHLVLLEERKVQGKPPLATIGTGGLLSACVARLYDDWFVEMRYRHQEATAQEARNVKDDVQWLHTYQDDLWR